MFYGQITLISLLGFATQCDWVNQRVNTKSKLCQLSNLLYKLLILLSKKMGSLIQFFFLLHMLKSLSHQSELIWIINVRFWSGQSKVEVKYACTYMCTECT